MIQSKKMPKILVLEFRNAGLFRKHRKTKDKMFDMYGRKDRKDETEFIEPITVHQISNMLHVLFGERPKPINRDTVYDNIPYLFDKALDSYLRIDTYKDAKGNFQSETMQTKKSVHNSWSTQSFVYWKRVNNLLGDELFKIFVDTVSSVYNININDTSFNKVKEMILNHPNKKIVALFELLKENKKAPIFDSIYGEGNEPTNINKNSKTQLTVLTGLDTVIRLSGQILVPISDEDIEKIKGNKGCATILDNGFVYIKGVKSSDIISVEGFTSIKEISLEKQ